MKNASGGHPSSRRQFLKLAGLTAGTAVFLAPTLDSLRVATAAAAPIVETASKAQCKKTTIRVNQQCTAPANPPANACIIGGTLPGRGIDGADIVWMVTLFFGNQWRIQFQAFSEEPDRECQYPVKVTGSYFGSGLRERRFSSSRGLDLGITPADFPELTLVVDTVKIDPCHPSCG